MEKVLNQEEIDAMVRKARTGNAAAGSTGPVVQPWDIRQAGQIGREQLRAINQLHELFARNLTNSIGGYLRIVFDVSLVSAEHLTFREFLQRVPETTYLASCDLAPADATAVLQLDLAIAFPIIDVMLGGEGKDSGLTRDITDIEEQILEAVVCIMCRELQTAWQAISLEFKFGQRQRMLQTQRLMPPEEKNLCLSFEIKMSETRGTLNLAVPAVVSNALLRKISADFSYQRPRSPIEARRQIEKKLLNCFFPVELALPDLQAPLQKLSDLVPGDLLSFSRSASAPAVMMVGDVRLCAAAPVRVGGRRAARVLSMEAPLSTAGEL
ncbi:MAG: flagellar motor switch protein FliM [Acidobacteriia bacterium]|nr:flagellar motor switch protein FliM [Terriglobia bacterium]